MALQMSYTSIEGTVYPKCYVLISNIISTSEVSTICTNFFENKTAYETEELPLAQISFLITTSIFGVGPLFDTAYDYLLTLPEFEGAVLVQELIN
jgi:hypothetical protein